MRRHPVHDHADISLVEIIDQIAKVVGSAVPRGGSIVIADLVAPRWSIRMFLQRQKLDMRETRFQNMFGKCRGHFAITKGTIIFLDPSAPGSKVNLVDRKWLAKVFPAGPFLHPFRIFKTILRLVDDGRSVWRNLGIESVRVGLHERRPAPRFDLILIELAGLHFWNEDLPNTGIAERPHRMPRAVPVVEVADDAYPFRVWSPNGKRNSFYAFMRDHVRAELLVNLLVPTFAKEIEIKFPQRR